MKKTAQMISFGAITWAVPFLTAYFFWSPSGAPILPILTIKTIMMLVGCLTTVILLCIYFGGAKSSQYLKDGILVGFIWLLINWALDFIFLLPLTHMPTSAYIFQIGLRYFVIPMTSIGMGYVLSKH